MDKSTCSIPGCDQQRQRREWCNAHYRRKLKAGEISGRTGVCTKCGDSFAGPKAGPMPDQCDTCRRGRTTCIGCGAYIGLTPRTSGKGMAPAPLYCSEECKPRCAVEACSNPVRKRGWCSNHYATWHSYGDPEAEVKHRWATEWLCKTCGNTDRSTWLIDSRQFCSGACKVTWRKYGGVVPESFSCAVCGIEVLYYDPISRKRLRSDAAYCTQCVREARTYTSAAEIAAEDGTDCKLCGLPVDMTAQAPIRNAPSVDHIIPRAKGGSDRRENLQLAHRGCNSSKRHYYVG